MSHYDWMNTWTGRRFWPLAADDPRNVVDVVDIAHSLANQCRYAGHCQFYSVAEHSVRVARFTRTRLASREVQQIALLHDASEAYLPDVIRPLKYAPEFAFYREVEKKLQTRIMRHFGLLGGDLPAIIADADSAIISDEARAVIPCRAPEWKLGHGIGTGYIDADFGWSPGYAEDAFLHEAAILGLYEP